MSGYYNKYLIPACTSIHAPHHAEHSRAPEGSRCGFLELLEDARSPEYSPVYLRELSPDTVLTLAALSSAFLIPPVLLQPIPFNLTLFPPGIDTCFSTSPVSACAFLKSQSRHEVPVDHGHTDTYSRKHLRPRNATALLWILRAP